MIAGSSALQVKEAVVVDNTKTDDIPQSALPTHPREQWASAQTSVTNSATNGLPSAEWESQPSFSFGPSLQQLNSSVENR
jgi:hypothetical protein